MNILMLLYHKFPPDIRVEKEARSLIKAGHNIYLIASDRKEYIKRIKNITVIYLKKNRFESLIFRLCFFRPFLSCKIKKIIKKYNINIIHVHDLPLVKTGYLAAKKFKLPVIADLHENYPAAVEVYQYGNKGHKAFLNKLFTNSVRCKRYETKILNKVNKIILVVSETYNQFKVKGLIPRNKFSIIMNTVDPNNFDNDMLDQEVIKKYEGHFIISYIGGFGIHRGIDTAIKAMRFINNNKIKLLLIGGSVKKIDIEMKNLAKKLGVIDQVEFISRVPFEEVQRYIETSDICLVPHNNFRHTQEAAPHKLFQYMYFKKPVLVSDCAPLKRIIEETKAGLVFKANDSSDMAEKIMELYNSHNLKEYGDNGYSAVIKKYNWFEEEKKLIRLYDEFKKE
jgi:glycosyltransferase involved in cell wall biosynthesis